MAAAIVFVGGSGLLAPSARAATYSYLYATPSTTYSAAAGASLTINVYLEETSTNALDPSLINDDGGLFAGAFTVAPTSMAAGKSSLASVAANVGVAPVGFDTVSTASVTAGVGTVSENVSDLAAVADVASAPIAGAGFNGVRLGSVTVHAGAAGSSTTFNLGPADGSFTNTNGYDLDDNTGFAALYDSAAATSFTVTVPAALPEPGSLAAMAIVGVALRRRRA